MQTCTVNGASKVCDVRVEKCPPCVFPRANKFDCFEYDAEARAAATCPFVSSTTNYVDCCTYVLGPANVSMEERERSQSSLIPSSPDSSDSRELGKVEHANDSQFNSQRDT